MHWIDGEIVLLKNIDIKNNDYLFYD